MVIHKKKLAKSVLGIGALCSSLFSSAAISGWDPATKLPQQAQTLPEFVPGEVLVKFREKVSDADIVSVENAVGLKKGVRFLASNNKNLKRWRRFAGGKGQTTENLLTALKNNPFVEYAEPNYKLSIQQFPNDPRFSELWGMHNTGQTGGTNDVDIDAPEAWDSNRTSSMVVAVIDTGIDYNHPDLAANMWHNPGEIAGNGIDDDGNGFVDDIYGRDFVNNDSNPMDDNGHGTHVAGTIGAVGNNGIGVAGVNWSVKIMALKFLDSTGSGPTSAAINAINYATQMGAKITNNSWGGGPYSQALYDAINAANNAGALFVAAAGNSGVNVDSSPSYPASYSLPNIITVAAIDHNNARASFSNYGAVNVDLGAPGVSILSTVPTSVCELCDATGYRLLNGTSMATPHVTGALALAWGTRPTLSNDQVKARLLASVDPVAALAGNTVTGGRLNLAKFLASTRYDAVATPTAQEVQHGFSAQYTLSFTSAHNADMYLQLSTGALANGLSASFADNTLVLPAGGNVNTTLTVQTTYGMTGGNHAITVLVNDGTTSLPIKLSLQVRAPSAELSVKQISPTSRLLVRGTSKSFPFTVRSNDNYAGPVALSAVVSDPTMTAVLSPASVNLASGESVQVSMLVSSTAATPIGEHPVTVSATANGVVRNLPISTNARDVTVCPSGCAYNAIQSAVNATPAGGVVVVGPGTYHERVTINKAMYIAGVDAASTVINGSGLGGSVVTIGATTAPMFSGFTVTGGLASYGAGINVTGNSYILDNIVRGNSASINGGGIYVNGSASIMGNVLESNSAANYGGGAMIVRNSATVNMKDNVFRANSAYDGGGLAFNTTYFTAYVRGNRFEQNSAVSASGASAMSVPSSSTKIIDGNVFVNNAGTAVVTGFGGSDVIKNALFAGNGKAIYFGSFSYASVVNSTITGNTTAGITASVLSGGQAVNCIVWNNPTGISGSVGVTHSILSAPWSGSGNIVANPLFVDAATGNYQLQAGSPAIDTGLNASAYGVTVDLNGVARPQDGDGLGAGGTGDGSDYDIGAFEYAD